MVIFSDITIFGKNRVNLGYGKFGEIYWNLYNCGNLNTSLDLFV